MKPGIHRLSVQPQPTETGTSIDKQELNKKRSELEDKLKKNSINVAKNTDDDYKILSDYTSVSFA